MENKLLKELYDHFYVRPELDEQENEVEECHKALIAALEKPERKLVLRIIDAQDISENKPPSTALSPALSWRGGFRRKYTMTKTSARSPIEPGERALVL